MDERSGGRRQETHEGECDGNEIDAQRKADAQPDGMDCCVGEALKIWQTGDIVAHQCNVSGLNSNIAAHTSHRNADVRCFERGSVIDAVANHTDNASRFLQCPNGVNLLIRQQFGAYGHAANLPRQKFCRFPVIPGEQKSFRAE